MLWRHSFYERWSVILNQASSYVIPTLLTPNVLSSNMCCQHVIFCECDDENDLCMCPVLKKNYTLPKQFSQGLV